MIKVTFNKAPELSLIPYHDMEEGILYLSSDKRFVILRSGYDNFVIFDLEFNRDISSYTEADFRDFIFDNAGAVMLFPAGTVNIEIAININ